MNHFMNGFADELIKVGFTMDLNALKKGKGGVILDQSTPEGERYADRVMKSQKGDDGARFIAAGVKGLPEKSGTRGLFGALGFLAGGGAGLVAGAALRMKLKKPRGHILDNAGAALGALVGGGAGIAAGRSTKRYTDDHIALIPVNSPAATFLRENPMPKTAFEVMEPIIVKGKLYNQYVGNRPGTMSAAAHKAGLKKVDGGYEALVPITDSDSRKRALKSIASDSKRKMERNKGAFGGRPWVGSRKKKNYSQARKSLATIRDLGEKTAAFPQHEQKSAPYDSASSVSKTMQQSQGTSSKTGLKGAPVQSGLGESKKAPTPMTTPNYMVNG